jgi:hypothetical protein
MEVRSCASILNLTDGIRQITKGIWKRGEREKEIVNFNPSIAHWKDDIYIVPVRIIRYCFDDEDTPINTPYDKRHPWGNKWAVTPECPTAIDGTMFTKCRIGVDASGVWTLDNIGVLDIDGTAGVQHLKYDRGMKYIYGGVDTRIFKTGNQFLLTFNSFSSRNAIVMDPGEDVTVISSDTKMQCKPKTGNFTQNCRADWCGHMMSTSMSVDDSKATISEALYSCINCSNKLEKNWVYGRVDNKLLLSYSLSESHTIMERKHLVQNKFEKCTSHSVTTAITQHIRAIENRTNNAMVFSLSTPYADFGDHLLGIGHCKIHYATLEAEGRKKDDPLVKNIMRQCEQFHNHIQSSSGLKHTLHYAYIYLMFFYTVSKIDWSIQRISDLFVPYNKEPYSVFFPAGLTRSHAIDDTYIVSYGVADIYSKIAVFTKTQITDLLNESKLQNGDVRFILAAVDPVPVPMDIDGGKGAKVSQTIFVLGRKRKISKQGRKTMVYYKKQWITLSEARKLERNLKSP